ncbi:hypothetical protein FG379_003677 [Cryptosporidium bovis]|uniref:uncharacterized protein n=1 Tax=Cryptosporidium bovis TaxID=310047 RepID=UPI00351A0915|nr:hypothetical protein FG379_003677 [Cryptosporidium bovis]
MTENNETRKTRVDGRKRRSFVNKDEYLQNLGNGPTIIVDCDYDDKHSERNIRSLVVQLSLSYSCIRKSNSPLKLIICGISDRLYEGLVNTLANNWVGVELLKYGLKELLNERYISLESENEVCTKNCDVIYLSADSDNVLQYHDDFKYNSKQVFIVGGIIDRNKHKNISIMRANELNLETARLPIKESGIILNYSEVLTVNHVVECIVKYNETANWHDTFNSILPKRKMDVV